MRKKTLIKCVEIILVFLFFSVLVFAISEGVKKSEKNECLKMQKWQKQYRLFTPAMTQYKQCERYNILLK